MNIGKQSPLNQNDRKNLENFIPIRAAESQKKNPAPKTKDLQKNLEDEEMKKVNIVTAVQAKAIRAICEGYVSETANKRYREIIKEIETNDVLSTLLHMIGEAMHKEEVELESDIIADLSSECSGNVYFDSYRYCLTQSREMKTTFKRLMGW